MKIAVCAKVLPAAKRLYALARDMRRGALDLQKKNPRLPMANGDFAMRVLELSITNRTGMQLRPTKLPFCGDPCRIWHARRK